MSSLQNGLGIEIGTGSPIIDGLMLQAGSAATGAGSLVWTSYGQAFSAVPIVTVTHAEKAEVIFISSAGTGSFLAKTPTASQDFTWIAVGTVI